MKVFIGSSKEGKDIVENLTTALQDRLDGEHTILPWTEVFDQQHDFVLDVFSKYLDECGAFIFIFTPDLCGARNRVPKAWTSPNISFEAGAAFGRYGRHGFRIVRVGDTEIMSDFSGVLVNSLPAEPKSTHYARTANKLVTFIQSLEPQESEIPSEVCMRWLSFIKCYPGKQEVLLKWLDNESDDYANKWGVEMERTGIIAGPHDDFILYTVPDQERFVEFIKSFRASNEQTVQQVDSRLVFPGGYYSRELTENQKETLPCQTLVLLSCKPHQVENVFDALRRFSARQEPESKIQIISVGITTGDDDVFFIAASENASSLRQFVTGPLLSSEWLQAEWLAENTTTLQIWPTK